MLDFLIGPAGIAVFGAAVVLALALDVLGQTVWDGPVRGRARTVRWLLRGAVVLLAVAAVGLTLLRFYELTA